MRHACGFSIGVLAGALVAATLSAATPSVQPAPPRADQASDDRTADLFTRMCNECHDSKNVVASRRTMADWEDVINKMIDRGAAGTEKEFETVFGYLLRNYGKVYINSATAGEITSILGLSKNDAESTVAYRRANGPFADFDAVRRVPGIDVKALDARKDAVAF